MKITTMTAALVGKSLAPASMAQTTAIPRSTNSDLKCKIQARCLGPERSIRIRGLPPRPVTAARPPRPRMTSARGKFVHRERGPSSLESKGYAEVTGLQKDTDGIWQGTAKKGGNTVKVWLDTKEPRRVLITIITRKCDARSKPQL